METGQANPGSIDEYIADFPPEKRATALAIYSMGISIGTLLGMAIGGIVAEHYGWRIALAAMSDLFIKSADAAHIPMEVLHRVVAMASGGMDTLPHNGAVITLLAVTGLTHCESYCDIFAITVIKTLAVFFVIAVYYATGLV